MSSQIPAQAPIDPTGRPVVDIEVYFEGGMDTVSIHANGRNQASVVVKYQVRDAAGKPVSTDGIHCELILEDTGGPLQTAGWIVDERPSPYIAVYPCLPQETESGQVRWIAPAPPADPESGSGQENEAYTYRRFYVSRPEMGAPVTHVSAIIVYNGVRHAAGDASPGKSLVQLGCLPSKAYHSVDLNVMKVMKTHTDQLTDDWNLAHDDPNNPANYWRRVDYTFTLADGLSVVTLGEADPPARFGYRVRGYYKTEPYLWPLFKQGLPYQPHASLWAGSDNGVDYSNFLLAPLDLTPGFIISFITTVTFSESCTVDKGADDDGMITFWALNGNQGTVYLDYDIPYYAAQTVPYSDEPGASAAAAYKGVVDSPNPSSRSNANANIKNSFGYLFDYVGSGDLEKGVFTKSKVLDRPEFDWAMAYSETSFPWRPVKIWCSRPGAGNIGRAGDSAWTGDGGEQLYAYFDSDGPSDCPVLNWLHNAGANWVRPGNQQSQNTGGRQLYRGRKDDSDSGSSTDAPMQTYPVWNSAPGNTNVATMNCYLFKLLDTGGGQLRVISDTYHDYHRVVAATGWARTDTQSIVKFLVESLDPTWP
jgi:hypothetical protein